MSNIELRYICEKLGIDNEMSIMISDDDALGILKAISQSYQLIDIGCGDCQEECPDCGHTF